VKLKFKRVDALMFAAKALGFPYVGPRLQRSRRQNRSEDFDFGFDEAEIQEHAILFCGQLQ